MNKNPGSLLVDAETAISPAIVQHAHLFTHSALRCSPLLAIVSLEAESCVFRRAGGRFFDPHPPPQTNCTFPAKKLESVVKAPKDYGVMKSEELSKLMLKEMTRVNGSTQDGKNTALVGLSCTVFPSCLTLMRSPSSLLAST